MPELDNLYEQKLLAERAIAESETPEQKAAAENRLQTILDRIDQLTINEDIPAGKSLLKG